MSNPLNKCTEGDNGKGGDPTIRCLFAAVFERAFNDLDYLVVHEMHIIESAVYWFKNFQSGGISFLDCTEVLSLRPTHMELIKKLLDDAQALLAACKRREIKFKNQVERFNFAIEHKHQVCFKDRSKVCGFDKVIQKSKYYA